MKFTINKKDYELKFGLDFIAHLDKKYHITQNGFKLGQGLTYVIAQIELGNPLILLDLIAAATLANKVKYEDIKKFVEEQEDVETLMMDFIEALKKSPTTRFTMKRLGQLVEDISK